MDKREFLRIARQAVREVMAKGRPSTLFEQAFFDLREKARGLKNQWEKKAANDLQDAVNLSGSSRCH